MERREGEGGGGGLGFRRAPRTTNERTRVHLGSRRDSRRSRSQTGKNERTTRGGVGDRRVRVGARGRRVGLLAAGGRGTVAARGRTVGEGGVAAARSVREAAGVGAGRRGGRRAAERERASEGEREETRRARAPPRLRAGGHRAPTREPRAARGRGTRETRGGGGERGCARGGGGREPSDEASSGVRRSSRRSDGGSSARRFVAGKTPECLPIRVFCFFRFANGQPTQETRVREGPTTTRERLCFLARCRRAMGLAPPRGRDATGDDVTRRSHLTRAFGERLRQPLRVARRPPRETARRPPTPVPRRIARPASSAMLSARAAPARARAPPGASKLRRRRDDSARFRVAAARSGPSSRASRVVAAVADEAKTATANRLTKDDLVAYIASGCKPKEEWRCARRPRPGARESRRARDLSSRAALFPKTPLFPFSRLFRRDPGSTDPSDAPLPPLHLLPFSFAESAPSTRSSGTSSAPSARSSTTRTSALCSRRSSIASTGSPSWRSPTSSARRRTASR